MPITDNRVKNIHALIDVWIDQSIETDHLPIMLVSLAKDGDVKIFSCVDDEVTMCKLLAESLAKIAVSDYTKTVDTATFKKPSEG
jgi:hypothetical protein